MNNKFYLFNQNNSGGIFIEPAEHVFIEAKNYEEANEIAQQKGLYFGGLGDCECCGDRWYELYSETDALDVPMVYGKSLEDYVNRLNNGKSMKKVKVPIAVVYFYDGTEKTY